MTLERSALVALKWTALGRMFGQTASWLITLVVLRLLNPEDYGLMALVSVVITITAAIADFGLGASLVQARELPPDLLRRIAGFVLALHLLLAAVLVVAAPLVAAFFSEPRLVDLIRVAALQFVFVAIGAVPQALAARALQFKWLARIEMVTSVAASACVLVLAWRGFGVWALVWGAVGGAALRCAMLVAGGEVVRPDFRLRGLGQVQAHVKFGASFGLSAIAWSALTQVDAVIGGRFLPPADLGAYAVALYLATLPMAKIMSVINQVAFSAVARLQDEAERLRTRLLQAMRLMNAASVPLLWGLSAVTPETVRVVLGAKWEPAVLPLQLICLVVPLRMSTAFLGTALAGVGEAGAALRCTLVAAAIWPICFVVGVQWGANGLALSWLAAVPLTFALNYPVISRILGLNLPQLVQQLLRSMAAGAAMYGAIVLVRAAVPSLSDAWRLPLLIVVGALVYLPLLWLLDRSLLAETKRIVAAMRG